MPNRSSARSQLSYPKCYHPNWSNSGEWRLPSSTTPKLNMEAVILIGIQGSGKSTFYRERFFDTHVRINLDMLKTRQREKLLP